MSTTRWNDYGSALTALYGTKVYRIGIDGGFSCPNRHLDGSGGCAFCDETGSVAVYQRTAERGAGHRFNENVAVAQRRCDESESGLLQREASIREQIARGKAFIERRYGNCAQSVYFQAFSGTHGSCAVLKRLYGCALSTGRYRELIVATRSDCIDTEKVALLASFRPQVDQVWVELGLQTGNDETLASLDRGETVADFLHACSMLQAASIPVCAHVILGLPGESFSHVERTAAVLREAGVEAVKIHNLHIVSGSRMYGHYLAGEVTAPSSERHLRSVIHLLRRLEPSTMIERFTSDTPAHRLAAPRDFGDKHTFVRTLAARMEELDVRQGDLL